MKKKTPEEMRQTVIDRHKNTKPFVKVYYQDFFLNSSRQFSKEGLVFDPENAVHVCTLALDGETREDIAQQCYRTLNIEHHLREQVFFARTKKAGHTSMSIGDFVVFEDGEALLCVSGGWEKHKFTQK